VAWFLWPGSWDRCVCDYWQAFYELLEKYLFHFCGAGGGIVYVLNAAE
jgi:hypothetical protein